MQRQERFPFFKEYSTDYCQNIFREGSLVGVFSCIARSVRALMKTAIEPYLHDHLVDTLYYALGVFTYIYFALSALTFFFRTSVPNSFPYIVDILSNPYLGALGVYVVVKEIVRRRNNTMRRRWGELFATLWLTLFVTASLATYFSEYYYLDEMYKIVATNSLAAIIIRIGTLIR